MKPCFFAAVLAFSSLVRAAAPPSKPFTCVTDETGVVAGGLGDPKRLLWFEQVALWGRQSFHSYYTAAATERHFGLGRREAVDLAVAFHPSGKRVQRTGVEHGTTVELREE